MSDVVHSLPSIRLDPPRSTASGAKRLDVKLPDHPPLISPQAARALLRILRVASNPDERNHVGAECLDAGTDETGAA